VNLKQKLIVTIVKKGVAKKIIKASKEAGAEGATVIMGTGTGVHEAKKLFFIDVDPEKEIILTMSHENSLNQVLDAIVSAGDLNKPGSGIAFVIDIKKTAGIVHLLKINA
jgi:nitrogen regulatory protein PII